MSWKVILSMVTIRIFDFFFRLRLKSGTGLAVQQGYRFTITLMTVAISVASVHSSIKKEATNVAWQE